MTTIKPFFTSSNVPEDKTWQQYCNFLKLSVEEFQAIQNEQLEESLRAVVNSPLGKTLFNGKKPQNYKELKKVVPLTTYDDYSSYFDRKDESVLPEKPIYWAFTSTSGGRGKHIPYTSGAQQVMLDYIMTSFILASSNESGHSRVNKRDIIIYNVAPRPFISGYIGEGIRNFGFRILPPLEIGDKLDIVERTKKGFQMALGSGVDILCSLSSVLVKMGETLTEHQTHAHFSFSYLQPAVLFRFARAYICSRFEKRQMLPKDLWKPKAIIGWGMDTSLYRDKIEYYWGKAPYEFHACTEAGVIALQAWNKKGMTLAPLTAFYEFIPEEDWIQNRKDPKYQPATVLADNLEPDRRYELVITSLHGMPFIRYRLGQFIKVISKDDKETGCLLPQIAYVGRSDDVIDIAGFTRLDEKTIWQAISQSQPGSADWVAAKEYLNNRAIIHIYLETNGKTKETEIFEH